MTNPAAETGAPENPSRKFSKGALVSGGIALAASGMLVEHIVFDNSTVSQQVDVSCAAGEPFVGAYIKTSNGTDETWAQWEQVNKDGSTARVTVTLPQFKEYHLNVGCGGTKEAWDCKLRRSRILTPCLTLLQ